ncbi:MAG TPA: pilus assembly protein TadG-related protein [Acidimicrobiia bacterium]|nr:pilus assembly protein TadG-related protein [Acidimicrobiia bacterium]
MTKIRERLMRRRAESERGFIMVTTALLTTMLLLFAGLAVDLGSWDTRAAEIKRAADAAALAGVVWMPDFNKAQQVALDTAQKNGFTNGQNNITVSVQQVANNNRRLQVTITDSKARQFFSQLALQGQSISRTSTAEYVLPVPLGSPKNTFGTGNLLSGSDTENFWAAVNGYCAGHESGDDRLAYYESYDGSTTSGTACNNGSTTSGAYDPNGYLYAIELPQAASSLKLDVYDAAFYNSGSGSSDRGLGGGNQTITTTYQIYDRNPTPLDLSNLTLIKTVTLAADASPATYQNTWANFYTWSNPQAGTYYIRVKTQNGQLNSRGSNGFGLRAYTGSSFATCSTIAGSSNYSANCPQIHGVDAISIYASIASTAPTFYLAQVDPIHAGKTMRVSLFDPGEGANSIQILDPNGNPVSFTWSTPCNPPTPPTGGCGTTASSIDVSGTGTQPYSPMVSNSKFNDRYLVLDVPLPTNYAQLYGTKVWWKVKYSVSSSVTDRTTWSVNIVGDPVHLLT